MAKKTAKEFSRKMVAQIATEYAKTGCEYSHDFFSRKYNIKEHTFYAILERAVVQNIVSLDIVNEMAMKAQINSITKAGQAGGLRSEKHYRYLVLKSKQYMLNKKETIYFTIEYANTRLSKDQFCLANYITKNLLNRTIYEAIVKNLVSDDIVEKLKEKSLQKDNGTNVIKFWEEIESSRRENRENQE